MSKPDPLALYDLKERPPAGQPQNSAEEKLALLERIADSAPILVSYVDAEERYRFLNKGHDAWFPGSSKEMTGKTVREVVGAEIYAQLEGYVKTALAGETVVYENFRPYPNGVGRYVRGTYVPDIGPDGVVQGFIAYVEDITSRKQVEIELIQSQTQLEQRVVERTTELAEVNRALQAQMRELDDLQEKQAFILRSLPVAFYRSPASENFRAVWVSEGVEGITGFPGRRFIEDPHFWFACLHPADQEQVPAQTKRIVEEGSFRTEYRLLCADRTYCWIIDQAILVRDETGQAREIIGCWLDITERKRAEESLKRSEEQFRSLIEQASDGIFISDAEGVCLEVNSSACAMLGYTREELLGRRTQDLVPEEERATIPDSLATLLAGRTVMRERHLRRKDGSLVQVEISAGMLRDGRVQGIVRDITERKRLEEQLNQAQKMESIGRLAGGIAHDFNNLLTAIIGYAELAAEKQPEGSPLQGDLEQIRKAGERAAALTAQLLAFARKQMIQPRPIDINGLMQNMDRLLQRLIGEDIELVTLPAANLATVLVDPGQFEQILVNLAVNARDAMPNGGRLTLETANVYLDSDYAQHHSEVTPGPYVLLAMSDTGTGIAPEVRARIFEPFFTTKEVGKGTGLGLATCYGIVKQAGGHIWVYSEPGKGTTFKIYLPQLAAPADILREAPQTPSVGGQETILLVEDEPLVREMAVQTLRELGYHTLTAANGQEALELARQHQTDIHLLITDVVLPRMSGSQIAARLKQEYPDLKVLYISGYTENAVVHHGVLDEGIAFLAKPFTPSSLSHKVREALEATEQGDV